MNLLVQIYSVLGKLASLMIVIIMMIGVFLTIFLGKEVPERTTLFLILVTLSFGFLGIFEGIRIICINLWEIQTILRNK